MLLLAQFCSKLNSPSHRQWTCIKGNVCEHWGECGNLSSYALTSGLNQISSKGEGKKIRLGVGLFRSLCELLLVYWLVAQNSKFHYFPGSTGIHRHWAGLTVGSPYLATMVTRPSDALWPLWISLAPTHPPLRSTVCVDLTVLRVTCISTASFRETTEGFNQCCN